MSKSDWSSTLTSVSPGFIQKYFESSRLHHLSTWKADLCDYVNDKMSHRKSSNNGNTDSVSIFGDKFRSIMHIDMDCFFVSVSIRDKPHLKDQPVAVAHSTRGTSMDYSSSEIASCNYMARRKGVRNGTFIGSAKKLCPELIIIPYEFEKYDEVSKQLYNVLIRHADFVQAVSCDEALIDVTVSMQKAMRNLGSSSLDDLKRLCFDLAEQIRSEMLLASGCVASVGISSSILLARLATKKAKPDGVHYISQLASGGDVGCAAVLDTLPIRDLPGIGWSLESRCKELSLTTCGDLMRTPLVVLQKEFGPKVGTMLHNYSMGQDERVLENKARQSVSCEINWGIRFTSQAQIDSFLLELCGEVVVRLHRAGMHSAAHVSVSAKKKLYEGEPDKFLGCGHCDDLSRSLVPGRAVDSTEALYQHILTLYRETGLLPTDVRGIGIHLKTLRRSDDPAGCMTGGTGVRGTSTGGISNSLGSGGGRGVGVSHRSGCNSDEEEDEDEDNESASRAELSTITSSPQPEFRRSSQTTLGFQRAGVLVPTVSGSSVNKFKSVDTVSGGSSNNSWNGGLPFSSSSSKKSGSVTSISNFFTQQSTSTKEITQQSLGVANKRPATVDYFSPPPVVVKRQKQMATINTTKNISSNTKSNALLEVYGISDPRSIDPEVLRSLPMDIQNEVAALMRS